ncbi:hypothetical protein CoNPh17_CDS0160 [Staphylococcus phage S-CoN_Ph17]|nr:hypothetical protein CoNPh17_CDS0160 [Staphylococcus phage S-CoN_Ph17]
MVRYFLNENHFLCKCKHHHSIVDNNILINKICR